MEFFKNFYKDDDKIVGLCAFKKKRPFNIGYEFEPKFGASKFSFEPKLKTNFFMV